MREVSFFLAFGYGVLSFVSPCILPLIPVYLANIAGTTDSKRRWQTFTNSVAFVVGFTIMFTLGGGGAGMLGSALTAHMSTIRRVIGGLLVAFGALMLASLKVPWLNYEKRLTVEASGKAETFELIFHRVFHLGKNKLDASLEQLVVQLS